PSVIAHTILLYRRIVVASPGYLARRGEPKTPGALADHQALVHLPGTGGSGRWRFTRGGEEQAVEVRGPVRTNAMLALHDAARAGLGVALLPEWMVEEDIAAGHLRRLLLGYETTPVTVSALYRPELRSSARVKAFLEHLIATLSA